MSFELSPQAFLFSVNRKIDELNQQITTAQSQRVIIPEPIVEFTTRQFRDQFRILRTEQVPFNRNQIQINEATMENNRINVLIESLTVEIDKLRNQIPVLQKDIEAKANAFQGQEAFETLFTKINALISTTQTQQTSFEGQQAQFRTALTNIPKLLGVPFPTAPGQEKPEKKDNKGLIIAALAAGAILL